ncbi:hypothetical protein HYFRA_00011916 [Hymenoscyphus fraxineus]|uniref:Uncharacterized protein n=1 Tax=Hymenoscyphus fraxineus TaxID=746836 RepID=A0A9N9KY75_9HELO|nr:hypothetical protein HYFRA_00011916 [Hymenoscyphus fraxineus]
MRFSSTSILLSLAALGSIPETLGRAVPNSEIELYNWNHVRAAPVRITPSKEVPPAIKPGSGTPSHTGEKPDGENTPRIGTGDKTPDTTTNEPPVHIGDSNVNNSPDIWCRGTGCGGEATPALLTTSQLTTRGDKGLKLAASPQKNKGYTQQEKDHYEIEEDDFVDVHQSIPILDQKYGFQEDEEGWSRMFARSRENPDKNVVEMSVGRAKDGAGKEYVAIIAHARFAKYDANRYKLNDEGEALKDGNGKLVPADGFDAKAVPASQLLHDAAKQSGKLDGKKPEKFFLISESITNDEAKRDIKAASAAMRKSGQANVLRKGAKGVEGDWFKILAGNDNNYSYLNTVGRNADTFSGYEVVSIQTLDSPLTMAMELSKV